MYKEVVVHIHNGVLLSHIKEYIWLSSNKVDEPRAYYTEWSKSEREKQISNINAYIWNLERWYQRTHLQGSNGDAYIENRLVDTVGEGESGINWESSIETWSEVKSLSRVRLFAVPWIVARQASLSNTNSQSLLKLMSIKSVMPSNHLILCHPLLLQSNSHWLSILHMVMYIFQSYSLKSSHPLLLPLSPKICSLCLCLLCCSARRIVSTIFLDSIYMC